MNRNTVVEWVKLVTVLVLIACIPLSCIFLPPKVTPPSEAETRTPEAYTMSERYWMDIAASRVCHRHGGTLFTAITSGQDPQGRLTYSFTCKHGYMIVVRTLGDAEYVASMKWE